MYDEYVKYSMSDLTPSCLTLIASGTEMLKVAKDGFYVRGIKVEQDDKEALIVYNAFKSFLMWAELSKK